MLATENRQVLGRALIVVFRVLSMALRVFHLLRPSISSFHVSLTVHSPSIMVIRLLRLLRLLIVPFYVLLMVHHPLIMILRVLIVVFRPLIASFRVLFVVVRPLIGVMIIIRTVGLDSSFWHINPWFYGLLRFKRYSHHFSLLSGHQVGVHFSCYNAKTY